MARALNLAGKVNITESKQRTCARQIHRPNHDYKTISDYYLKVLTKESLAHLYNQLDTRFDSSSMPSYEGLAIVPSKIISSFYFSNNNWRDSFKQFVQIYQDDFPKIHVIDGELDA